MPRPALPFAALLWALILSPACGVRTEAASDTLGARFQAELDTLAAEFHLPGATAAFILPDGRVGAAATGLADVERGLPMTPASRMLAASIGKTFVAATVLALAGEGALGLEDPIAGWLGGKPWFDRLPNGDATTIRHLLTHTSGIPDHVRSPEFARAWRAGREEGRPLPPDTLVTFVLNQPPLFPPGEGWAYSDTGYILLGMIVEAASGERLYAQIERRFITPMGLSRTSPSDRRNLPGLAAGYTPSDNPFGLPAKTTAAPGVMAWDPSVEWAGGGLVSTSLDLAVWARALYEGRAMEVPYLGELLEGEPVDPGSDALRYGAAVAIREGGEWGPTLGHGGDIPGYVSSMRYYPDRGVAIVFQVNAQPGGAVGDFGAAMETRLARVVLTPARD